MKLFKLSILAMFGMALTLTACHDDEYTEGAQSPGAYFADNLPEVVAIPLEGSSFDVVVSRTGADAPASYNLTATDPSGLFTIPTTVEFADGALTSVVNVTFDPTKIVTDKEYPITLTLSGASEYGQASYSFVAVRANPIETEDLGVARFDYASYLNGYSTAPTYKSWNPADPNHLTITMSEWGMQGIPFNIDVPDVSAVEDGDTHCYVLPQYSGMDSQQYGQVWVADMYTYLKDVLNAPASAQKYAEDTYYTVERGLFTLHLIYYIPFYGDGDNYLAEGTEYLQLPGYPDQTISVEYIGTMMKPDGTFAANVKCVPGPDVAKYNAVVVPGDDPAAGIKAILDGAEGVQEVSGAAEATLEFPITEGGVYTAVAVTFDENGEAIEFGSATFEIMLGEPAWNEVGMCDYVDGFIAPGFNAIGISYAVPLLQSKKDANIYYLDSPYTQEAFPIYANNENTMKYRIAFSVEDPTFVYVTPQTSGYKDDNNFGGMVTIGNLEGMYVEGNPGVSFDAIKSFLLGKDPTRVFSTFEDGVVTINNCLFSDKGEFGYNWRSKAPGYIYFPEASDAAKRKAAARNVARPVFKGMNNIAAKSLLKKEALSTTPVQAHKASKLGGSTRLK